VGIPFITVVPCKPPNTIFNFVSRFTSAAQLNTKRALSVGKAALVVLDNGQGATFALATCDTDKDAETKAKRLRAELMTTDFNEWSRLHDVPSGFLDRPQDRGELQKLIAGFWPFRLRNYI
jgi:hypothetical protein